jgi:phosphatidylglycerophosphatase C
MTRRYTGDLLPRTVIFDLDRTLINCDSFANLMNSLLMRNWWRVGAVVVASPLLLPLWTTDITRTASISGLLWFATVGLDQEEFRVAVSSQAHQLALQFKPTIYRDGVQVVKEHLEAGDRVVIVTGSSCELAMAFCAAIGLDDVIVIGSTFRNYARGWITDEHCVGEHKVSMLADVGITPPWSVVYTDSASDLPLLRLAQRRCVVNPRPKALRRLQRSLGSENLEILHWR